MGQFDILRIICIDHKDAPDVRLDYPVFFISGAWSDTGDGKPDRYPFLLLENAIVPVGFKSV